MCGIIGRVGPNAAVADAGRLIDLIRHRGPDGHGAWRTAGALFAHARLAVIDLDTGAQPMESSDGRFCIVFNGEIYNYRTLRDTLIGAGHRFVTESDTEVVLRAFIEWGPPFVERLRGMFALAIADTRDRSVILARDPFGIKPLFYASGGGGVGFASELGALVTAMGQPLEVPAERLDFFFRYGHVPAPLTLYRGFHKLAPGHWVRIDFDGRTHEPVCYFHGTFDASEPTASEEEVEAVLQDSVRAHLIADVPRGILLSGGVDSSLLSIYAARDRADLFSAYTIEFREGVAGGEDAAFAAELAARLGLTRRTRTIDGSRVDQLPELLRHFGEPFGDSSILPTDLVSGLAREDVPVVLSGEGADEMFGGYAAYARWLSADVGMTPWRDLDILRRLSPARWRDIAKRWTSAPMAPAGEGSWEEATAFLPRALRCALWQEEWQPGVFASCPPVAAAAAEAEARGLDRISFAQHMHLRTHLANDMLAKADVASMRHGLEIRTPFLDREVFAVARRVKPQDRVAVDFTGAAVTKAMLKRILARHTSARFAHRRKRGFEIPTSDFFGAGSASREMLDDLTLGSSGLKRLVRPEPIERLLKDPLMNRDALWFLLVLGVWWDQHGRQADIKVH